MSNAHPSTGLQNSYKYHINYIYSTINNKFPHFARVLFSRNFAYVKFHENKTLAKISEFTVFLHHFNVTSLFFIHQPFLL